MITKLLVALDGSERADGVFRYAVALADSLGGSLELLSVITVPPEFPPAAHVVQRDELTAYLLAQAKARLHAFAARVPHLRVNEIVRESMQPWRAIIDVADGIGADLIVVGSHGYHGLDYLLGTNAGKVANEAHCNVLVVRCPPDQPPPEGYRHAAVVPGTVKA